jgi:hypothetical protein
MNQTLFKMKFLFFCGFAIGTIPAFLKTFDFEVSAFHKLKHYASEKFSRRFVSPDGLYDETMAQDLFHEVRVLCWVFTHPENHKEKAVHIKNLWGKRCNKLLFMSTEEDALLGTVALPVGNGREQLWNKSVKTYEYVSFQSMDLKKYKDLFFIFTI